MNSAATVTQKQLADFLINVAIRRPVFIWGPPGIGKSSLVQQFAAQVGLPCVSLLGSQLAPEDDGADPPSGNEGKLYADFCERGIPASLRGLGAAGPLENDMILEPAKTDWQTGRPIDWQRLFGQGLAMAAASAVSVAAGRQASLTAHGGQLTQARRARDWLSTTIRCWAHWRRLLRSSKTRSSVSASTSPLQPLTLRAEKSS